MTLIDYLLWAAILVAGLTLAAFYGASWRAVAKAMARAQHPIIDEQPIIDEPVGALSGSTSRLPTCATAALQLADRLGNGHGSANPDGSRTAQSRRHRHEHPPPTHHRQPSEHRATSTSRP